MERRNKMIVIVVLVALLLFSCQDTSVEYSDGVYKKEDNFDERGWKARIEIKVEGEKITSVKYEEENEEGEIKSKDEEYGKIMEETSGVSPKEAYEKLEADFIKSQNIKKVDTVTGATASSERFFKLAKQALSQDES